MINMKKILFEILFKMLIIIFIILCGFVLAKLFDTDFQGGIILILLVIVSKLIFDKFNN